MALNKVCSVFLLNSESINKLHFSLGEGLSPEDTREGRDSHYTADDKAGAPFQPRAAEDDVSDADFSSSRDDDLKRISGASEDAPPRTDDRLAPKPGEQQQPQEKQRLKQGVTPLPSEGQASTPDAEPSATPVGQSPAPRDDQRPGWIQ